MKNTKRALLFAGALFLAAGTMSCGVLPGAAGNGGAFDPGAFAGNTGKKPASSDFFAMDTFMTLTAYGEGGEAAVESGKQEVLRLDGMFSTGKANSEIGRLNRGAGTEEASHPEENPRPEENTHPEENARPEEKAYPDENAGPSERIRLDAEAFSLLARAMEISKETDGAFDPCIYPLMKLWGFAGPEGEEHEPALPPEEEIQRLLPLCKPENVELDPDTKSVRFLVPGTEVDLGGAVKGYASAKLMDIFRANGVTSGLVNLGGNVQVLGAKPDGSFWRIGIEDPEKEGNIAALSLMDTAAVTSGGYERGFLEGGRHYHHILDPETGYPADGGLLSVTVVTEDGALADMLSTALFVMGREKAERFCLDRKGQFEAVLITEERELLVTEGLEGRIESAERIRILQ